MRWSLAMICAGEGGTGDSEIVIMASQYVELLREHGISVDALVYNTSSVFVYKSHTATFECASKVILFNPSMDWQKLQSECEILKAVSHPNILKILDFFWEQTPTECFLCIVTEWKAKDLWKDVTQRKAQHYRYTEAELWTHLRSMVSALAYLQRNAIAHRDIKPQNLFLGIDGQLIVGDFGSARLLQEDVEKATLAGTPFFLSPKLKEALVRREQQCVHDPFKSDVYSLGLTILTMMLLEPPTAAMLSAPSPSSEWLANLLAPLPYSENLKDWVKLMCAHREEDRCDFLFADQILNQPVYDEQHRDAGESMRISASSEEEKSGEQGIVEESMPESDERQMKNSQSAEYLCLEPVSEEEISQLCTFCSRGCPPDTILLGKTKYCRLDCLIKTLNKKKGEQTWLEYFRTLIFPR